MESKHWIVFDSEGEFVEAFECEESVLRFYLIQHILKYPYYVSRDVTYENVYISEGHNTAIFVVLHGSTHEKAFSYEPLEFIPLPKDS